MSAPDESLNARIAALRELAETLNGQEAFSEIELEQANQALLTLRDVSREAVLKVADVADMRDYVAGHLDLLEDIAKLVG